ncbi:crossover junction endodeoxyribonuclease RuvC [bacterium]|nr:MAG: crossover junction endodeoxyribonuclease RuvC [bacterium]
MIVLGIDPGTQILGWGVVDGDGKNRLRLIESGIYRVGSRKPASGLAKIYDAVSEIIEKHSPNILVVESPFYGLNVKTLIRLGEARGAILLCAYHNNVSIESISPAEAKLALTGNGNATKNQVAYMVKNILNIKEDIPLDTSDAIAIAIAYLHRQKISA